MPWGTRNRLGQNKWGGKRDFLRKRLTVNDFFKANFVGRESGHIFAATALGPQQQKLAIPLCSAVNGGQYVTKYLVCDTRVDIASGTRG